MLGTVAQVIALTAYGNAFLQDPQTTEAPPFYPSNSTFQFCEFVRFVDVSMSGTSKEETAWAADPTTWFERLKKEHVYALHLHYTGAGGTTLGNRHVADRMLAGFVGGGGRWLIETVSPRGSDYWEARWEVGDRSRTDRKIWRVTYRRVAHDQTTRAQDSEDLRSLKGKLEAALTEIEDYARAHRLENFATIFQKSRSQLSSDMPGQGVYHSDLSLPGRLSTTAQQLLSAGQIGWVFGGMGSWNDTGPGQDDKEYERVSQELFDLLNRSYVAVANTTAASAPVRPASGRGFLDRLLRK